MNPFVLSRNIFNNYCSEYTNLNSSTSLTNNNNYNDPLTRVINYPSKYPVQKTYCRNENYNKAVDILNQRYEYFLKTLDRLQISLKQSTENHNINSISNRNLDTLTVSSISSKRSNKKHLYKMSKRRMPKVLITVSCAEHRTHQQPNIKMY
ncbi:unnamed protein product [Adineta steineri]|uniref:Uncharacterized protein n=1 Tax=Adineta steineri TaxID=433720 RepID=A0A819QI69_9BILA|nr:unnamed protein product [Adineta steineri]CAF0773291.1 unnamed protein product [Adineta steineri]CAF4031539.1 unnamed protein product [Adineta steineri]